MSKNIEDMSERGILVLYLLGAYENKTHDSNEIRLLISNKYKVMPNIAKCMVLIYLLCINIS